MICFTSSLIRNLYHFATECCCNCWALTLRTVCLSIEWAIGIWLSWLKHFNCWWKAVKMWFVIRAYSMCNCMFTWQRPLRYWKKNFRSVIYTQHAFIWCKKNCKNRTWFAFCLRHKIGCHGNVPWGIGKNGPDQENSRKCLPFGKKIVKIGAVDTEIALLIVNKEEINASKIYSPVGNLAERAK